MDGRVLAPHPLFFPFLLLLLLIFLLGTKVLPEKQRRLRGLTLRLSERTVQRPLPLAPESRVSSLTPALRSSSLYGEGRGCSYFASTL